MLVDSSSGYLNYFKKTVIDKLGEPYNKCEDNTDSLNSPLTKEIRARGSVYKQRICFNLCRLYFIQELCNCSLQYQLWTNGNDTCNKDCVKSIVDTFDYIENCKSCPVECDSVLYETRIEKSNISIVVNKNANWTERFSNVSIDSILKNLTILNFNYERMEYTEIKEMPRTTFVSLIGELGGTLGNKIESFFYLFLFKYLIIFFSFFLFILFNQGVFLGLSFVSLIEILEMIIRIIWIMINNERR